jgi:hypothetical protein
MLADDFFGSPAGEIMLSGQMDQFVPGLFQAALKTDHFRFV